MIRYAQNALWLLRCGRSDAVLQPINPLHGHPDLLSTMHGLFEIGGASRPALPKVLESCQGRRGVRTVFDSDLSSFALSTKDSRSLGSHLAAPSSLIGRGKMPRDTHL